MINLLSFNSVLLKLLLVECTLFQFTRSYVHYFCEEGSTIKVIAIENSSVNEFVLNSHNFPSSTTEACTVVITVDQKVSLYATYMYAYYNQRITYACGLDTDHTDYTYVEDNHETVAFSDCVLSPGKNASVFFAQPRTDEFSGFQLFFQIMERVPVHCSTTKRGLVNIGETLYLAAHIQYASESCEWTIRAENDFDILLVKILDYDIWKNEKLVISGIVDGVPNTRTFENTLTSNHTELIVFGREVNVTYLQSGYEFQGSFAIVISPTIIQNRSCDLAFDHKVFRACAGTFSNIIPHKTYKKNQYCSWKVAVPQKAVMHVTVNKDDATEFTGDQLVIMDKLRNYTYQVWPSVYQFTINGLNQDELDVTFIWETDGVVEYSGFSVAYIIDGCNGAASNWLLWNSSIICIAYFLQYLIP